jgi:hypothetical protein
MSVRLILRTVAVGHHQPLAATDPPRVDAEVLTQLRDAD